MKMSDAEIIAAIRLRVAAGEDVANEDAKVLLRVGEDAFEIVERGFVPERDGRLLYTRKTSTSNQENAVG